MPKLSEQLPEEFKPIGERYAEPVDLAKAYVELEKKQGKMVTIDETPETRTRAFDLLGFPKTVEDYKDVGPDTPLVKRIAEKAARHRIPKDFVKEAVAEVISEIGGETAKLKQQVDADMATLKVSWGPKHDVNMDIARRGAEKFAGAAKSAYDYLQKVNPALAIQMAFDAGVKEVNDPSEPPTFSADPSLTPESAAREFDNPELNKKAFGDNDPVALARLNKLGAYLEKVAEAKRRR